MEAYSSKIAKVLSDPIKSEFVITQAAAAVKKVAAGVFDRDSIRTEPFTKKVIAELTTIQT